MGLEAVRSVDRHRLVSFVLQRLQADSYKMGSWRLPHWDVQACSELNQSNLMYTTNGIGDPQFYVYG